MLFPLTAGSANGDEPGAGTTPALPGAGETSGPGIGSQLPQLLVSGVKYGTIIAITAQPDRVCLFRHPGPRGTPGTPSNRSNRSVTVRRLCPGALRNRL